MSPVTIPALTTIVHRQFKEDRTLCPVRAKVLFGSNQRPERVSIPLFHLLQKRTHLRHQTRYSFFLVETTILLCYKQANQQALDLVQVKAQDIRALRPLRPFTVGYRWTKSCKPVTGKLTTHLPIFT